MSSEQTTPRTAPPRNIPPGEKISEFKPDASALDKLQVLADYLETRTTSFINWFLEKKETPKRYSRWIRVLAIVLTTLGGLCPLLANVSLTVCSVSLLDTGNLHQWGYIFMALAGALILADRYFGCSNSWMRHMNAQVSLQRALDRFRLAWAFWRIQNPPADNKLNNEQITTAINLLTNFQAEVSQLMADEFEGWLNEFREQLRSLQNSISKGQEDKQPGKIIVRIDAPAGLSGPREILIDQQRHSQTPGNDAVINSIAPGSYLLGIRIAACNGHPEINASENVIVAPGQTVVAAIKLETTP